MNSLNQSDPNDEELKRQIMLRNLMQQNTKPMIGNDQTAGVARSVANAGMLLFGGKPQFEQNNNGPDIQKLYAAEAIKKGFESPIDDQLKQARINMYNSRSNTDTSSPLPTGFVSVRGKVMRDPTYKSPATSMFGAEGVQQLGDANKVGEEYLKTLNPEEARIVKGISNYELNPTSMFAGMKGAAARAQYVQAAKQFDPSYSDMEFPTRAKYLQDQRSGKVAQNVRSLNTATPHLQTLSEKMGGLASSPFPVLNKVQNWWMRQTGNPAPAEVDAALHAVAGELATIFKNTSGTDQEIGNWLKTFDPNGSAEQKHAFINTAIELMQGRQNAMQDQYKSTMGKEAPENAFISPSSMAIMNRLKGGNQPSFSDGNNKSSAQAELDQINAQLAALGHK